MKKNEVLAIIKDMEYFAKNNEANADDKLEIITTDMKYIYLCEYDGFEELKKIDKRKIEIAVFVGSYNKAIYLKNGLASYRKAKKANIF